MRHPTSAACIIIFSILSIEYPRVTVPLRVQDDQIPCKKLYFLVFMLFITMSSVFDLRCDIDIILLFNFMKNSVNSCRALQIFIVLMQVLLVLFFPTIL